VLNFPSSYLKLLLGAKYGLSTTYNTPTRNFRNVSPAAVVRKNSKGLACNWHGMASRSHLRPFSFFVRIDSY
jgi:hypothetical protein